MDKVLMEIKKRNILSEQSNLKVNLNYISYLKKQLKFLQIELKTNIRLTIFTERQQIGVMIRTIKRLVNSLKKKLKVN